MSTTAGAVALPQLPTEVDWAREADEEEWARLTAAKRQKDGDRPNDVDRDDPMDQSKDDYYRTAYVDDDYNDDEADVEPTDEAAVLTDTEVQKLMKRSAFVSVVANPWLKGKRKKDVIIAAFMENVYELRPEFVLNKYKSYQFVFSSSEQRDQAVQQSMTLFKHVTKLELPRPRINTKRTTLYISDIPITIEHQEVANWLKAHAKDLMIRSGFRWMEVKDTGIKTGVRSVVVETPSTVTFPGFAWFICKGMRNAVKVRIWHVGIGDFCRKCMHAGHLVKDCRVAPAKNPSRSYASAVTGRSTPKPATEAIGREPTTTASPVVPERPAAATMESKTTTAESVTTTSTAAAISTAPAATTTATGTAPTTTTPAITDTTKVANGSSATTSKAADEPKTYLPFFRFTHFLSNHYPCKFSADNVTFSSTEHYLFYHKAKAMGQLRIARDILESQKAADAKRLGETVVWDPIQGKMDWHTFASHTLFTANSLKYETHPDLRQKFFETAPAILVEASPTDIYWGVGLTMDDDRIHDPKNWRGKNAFGNLLTKLRDQMMEFFASEVSQDSGNRKRKNNSFCDLSAPYKK